jgi:tetratricopeptide (TPR) repeat protein
VDQPSLLAPASIARLGAGDWLHVIATTRLGGDSLHLQQGDRMVIEVDALDPDDAVSLIEVCQPGERFTSDAERAAAREIARRLDGFTLAVEAAAVYLGLVAPTGQTCAGFAELLRYTGLDIIEDAGRRIGRDALRHREVSLQATLLPVLESLRPEERLTLEYAAALAPDMIAVQWLRSLVGGKYPAVARDAAPGAVDPWLTILRRLIDLQLLRWTGSSDEAGRPRLVRVHRIVQELTHALPGSTPQAREGRGQQVLILSRQRDDALEKAVDTRPMRWELEPLTALGYWWSETGQSGAGWLLAQCGIHWYKLADWTRSEAALRRALAFDLRTGGTANTNVARDQECLARVLMATNRREEAEGLLRKSLATWERAKGPADPALLPAMTSLGLLLYHTNRLADAEPLLRGVVRIQEVVLARGGAVVEGAGATAYATALDNLAQLLYTTNRLSEAELLMQRALAIDEARFGKEHPQVATHLSNLAQLLQATNRLSDAETLMRRVVSIYEAGLGSEHPNVADALNNLAVLLQATNRLSEAEPLIRRALAIDEASYGTDHPKVAIRFINLAVLLQATNRLSDAEPLMWRALAINERSYGNNHPNVAIDLMNLAHLLKATNRLSEAEPLMRRVLAIFFRFQRATGHLHPHLQVALNNYATLLSELGRSPEEIHATLHTMAPDIVPPPPAS